MLIDLVRRAAAEPGLPAVITDQRELSYTELLATAESLGAALLERGLKRFGAALEDPADIVTLLVAASAAGVEVCVYPRDLDDDAVDRFAAAFDHAAVVCDRPRDLSPDVLPLADLRAAGTPPVQDDSPVLVLTTGTTGAPKGARHDWRRLAAGVRHPDDDPGARWLLAYNLNQFAGLQILLHVLASRATLIAPPSARAEDAIAMMERHGATCISATPTFWRLLAGRLDPASAARLPLRQITLGGEASPASLLRRLRALFPAARITHVYAGTEFGTAVSVSDGEAGLPLSVLERRDDAPVQIRVVDGELHVRSAVGMSGYHGSADGDGWHATGDMVDVTADRIEFVGRATEIINVGGAKVHPLPVEDMICSVPGVENAAVYGRENAVTGQIVAADVVAAPGADQDELLAEIRATCQALPRPGRPRRIRFVTELGTRGSKVVRQEAGR